MVCIVSDEVGKKKQKTIRQGRFIKMVCINFPHSLHEGDFASSLTGVTSLYTQGIPAGMQKEAEPRGAGIARRRRRTLT